MIRVRRFGLVLLVVDVDLLLDRIGRLDHFAFLLELTGFLFALECVAIVAAFLRLLPAFVALRGAGILQAAERVAVCGIDFQDQFVSVLSLCRIFRGHVGKRKLVQDRLVLGLAVLQRFVGEAFEFRITERQAGIANHDVGLGMIGIRRQNFFGLDQLFLRRAFRGESHDLHAGHLLREGAHGLVLLDFDGAQKPAAFEVERLVFHDGLHQRNRVIVILRLRGRLRPVHLVTTGWVKIAFALQTHRDTLILTKLPSKQIDFTRPKGRGIGHLPLKTEASRIGFSACPKAPIRL